MYSAFGKHIILMDFVSMLSFSKAQKGHTVEFRNFKKKTAYVEERHVNFFILMHY